MAKRTTTKKSKSNSCDTVLSTDAAGPVVYQLKVHLIGISPMIWRRFLVSGDSTLSDLHYILQLVMGWSDYHLNCFVIHGKRYGVDNSSCLFICEDTDQIRVADLGLREREKFRYEYDFTDRWHHQLRVEAILRPDEPLTVPICVAGARMAPPEDCGGVMAYLEKRQHYSYGYGIEVLADIHERGREAVSERAEEIRRLMRWLSLDKFDCDGVNHRLKQYAEGDREWLFAEVIR
ncbi:MAG: plasmid pRiA4b ORF-3 family protein [Cyanobacteria bacterium J06614_10]